MIRAADRRFSPLCPQALRNLSVALALTAGAALPILGLGSGCAPATAGPAPAAPRLEVPAFTSHLGEHHPLVGQIFDPRTGRMVTREEAARRIRAAAILTIGEKHDNPDHHRIEGALLALAAHDRRAALVVEMVATDKQLVLDGFRETTPPPGVERLAAALDWEHSGWPPFAEYRPLFAVAVQERLPIFAGDVPHAAAHEIAHHGIAGVEATLPSLVSRFDLKTPLAPAVQSQLEQEVADVHCGMLPAQMLPAMSMAQRVRDASLAGAVLDARTATRAEVTVLVSGNGHARDDRGVPALLGKAGVPRAQVLSVAILEVDDAWKDPADYAREFHASAGALPFDLALFTPRANEDDPCAGMTMKK